MFDCLLGSKFSKKCKYCVKCINSRVALIRKKKQATVKFLKKDVADLLANGHDSNAFGRIEALIVEMNLTSCYDMIEKYCQCILDKLPFVQKQRECPEEAMEAVATLIFATARFSDLPELFDLRRVFTERYGSHMVSYVNAEFVEKLQKKTFSTDRKIRLMQDIAEEFSVGWDYKSFRQRQANPTDTSSDQPKRSRSSNNGQGSHAEINQRNVSVSKVNEAVFTVDGQANGRKTAAAPSAAASANRRKEAMFKADVASIDRDSAALNAGGSFNGRKEAFLDAGGSFKGRNEVALNADISVNGRKERIIDSSFGVNRRNACADQVFPSTAKWETPRAMFMQRQQVQPEPKDIHVIPNTRDGRLHGPDGSNGKGYAADREAVNVEPGCGSADGYGYVKVSKNNTPNGDCFTQKVSLYGIQKDARSRLPRAQDVHDDLPVSEKVTCIIEERTTRPVKNWRENARPMNMIPPYTKPNFKNSSMPSDDSKLTDIPIVAADNEMHNGRPVSVRRRLPNPPTGIETDISTNNAKPIADGSNGEVNGEYQRKAAAEEVHGQRRHGGRRSTAKYNGVLDEDDAAMDRLLVHYSKKGMDIDPGKRRTRSRAPPEETAMDSGRGAVEHCDDRALRVNGRGNHRTAETAPHRPDRLASLHPVPVIGVGVGKGPHRATSMHPDSTSLNGGRLQPEFLDYDDLAARFIALKKS